MITYFVKSYSDRPKGKLCHEVASVRLLQNGKDTFTVQYGLQVKSPLTYDQAASEYGACIMHQAACDGTLDNREKNEH